MRYIKLWKQKNQSFLCHQVIIFLGTRENNKLDSRSNCIRKSIKKYIKDFEISYNPDERQKIADSWPNNVEDSYARNDWGWKEKFDLEKMTKEIIMKLKNINNLS